jgi:hypothetical protein
MAKQYNMETTPVPPLTWDTPALRALFRNYWDTYRGNGYRFSDETDDYSGPYCDSYKQNGYLHAKVPEQEEMLDNDIHPIFAKSIWVVDHERFDEYYGKIKPALQLFSKLLEESHFLKWWAHLAFGTAGFERGWVAIKEDPNEISQESIEHVKEKLLELAGKVRIKFLVREDMDRALGATHYNMQEILGIFKKEEKRKRSKEESIKKRG